MANPNLRAAILGAGFISKHHLRAIQRKNNVDLVAVCDLNEQAASQLVQNSNTIKIYTSLNKMLEEADLDVIHVLTQPDSHYVLGKAIINAGCNVIFEKPVTVDLDQAIELSQVAEEKNVAVAVSHNFIFSRPYLQLTKLLKKGGLGPIKTIRIVWKKTLPQITSGPFDLWMLRKPENILFETGSHAVSELLAIVGQTEILEVVTNRSKILPTGTVFHQSWSISAKSGQTLITIDTSFDMGYEQHFVEVEGTFGIAKADIENDVFYSELPTGRMYDSERLHVNTRAGLARIKQAMKTYFSYATSKFNNLSTGGPFETSVLNSIDNCYEHIFQNSPCNNSSIEFAISIAKVVESIQTKMPVTISSENMPTTPTTVSKPILDAKVLIVGATGFIGKKLLMELQEKNITVRALIRNASSLVGVAISKNTELMLGDYRNESIIEDALYGIEVVIHLAVAHSTSLSGYLKADSDPTIKFARLCQKHNIKRFIYAGTIDSLNLSKSTAIREIDSVDRKIKRRNNYAHSKAITETRLNDLYLKEKFPIVILRPAIVLGVGGPVTHVGVASWFDLGHCAYWGTGSNKIPIILVDDVAKAMALAIDAKGIDGKTYNLSSPSCISAKEYVQEVERILGSKIVTSSSNTYKLYFMDMFKWIIKVIVGHPDKSRIPSLHDWNCRKQISGFDTEQAETDLKWKPISDKNILIKKGIHEPTIAFLDP
ncbi:MAG: hypothetical protein COA74_04855 [Gammaproteobacteria bacterium]|nr:MAG: hypothetical protein COA74_04855 [Gammaproteobacteria bacterium]